MVSGESNCVRVAELLQTLQRSLDGHNNVCLLAFVRASNIHIAVGHFFANLRSESWRFLSIGSYSVCSKICIAP